MSNALEFYLDHCYDPVTGKTYYDDPTPEQLKSDRQTHFEKVKQHQLATQRQTVAESD